MSACQFVTRVNCVKTVEHILKQSAQDCRPRTPVFQKQTLNRYFRGSVTLRHLLEWKGGISHVTWSLCLLLDVVCVTLCEITLRSRSRNVEVLWVIFPGCSHSFDTVSYVTGRASGQWAIHKGFSSGPLGSMVEGTEGQYKGTNAPFLRSPVVCKEGTRPVGDFPHCGQFFDFFVSSL